MIESREGEEKIPDILYVATIQKIHSYPRRRNIKIGGWMVGLAEHAIRTTIYRTTYNSLYS